MLETLRRPLEDDNDEENQIEMNSKENALFYISKINKYKLKNFHHKILDHYLDENILRLFTDAEYKSTRLRAFLRDKFQPNESRGKFLLGLESSTLDWLLYKFSQISQNNKYFNMHKCVNKLLIELF